MASAAMAVTVLLSACGTEPTEPDQTQPSHTAETPAPMDSEDDSLAESPSQTGSPAGARSEIPQTPAGEITTEVVELINAETESTPADWRDRLHESFSAQISAEELAEIINTSIRPGAPWTVSDYQGTETEAVTTLESSAAEVEMHLQLDADQQLISTLVFTEPYQPADTAESFQEIEQRLSDFPAEVAALILDDGDPVLEINPTEAAPVASVAKLYVLSAAVEAIEQGETGWQETIELTDELRSLPSGTLQDQPDGYETSLFDVAHRMIELSDNTGTDMLIEHLGREAVEAAVIEAEHHDPQMLQPFMTTQELFQLRWEHPELGADWASADEQTRREILAELGEHPMEIGVGDTSADDVDLDIDWYASAYDVAGVHHQLADQAQEHPELVSIMGTNPGLLSPVEDPWWDELGFKGGSVPGVLTGSWLAETDDGERRTVVLLASNEDAAELAEASQDLFALAQDALTVED